MRGLKAALASVTGCVTVKKRRPLFQGATALVCWDDELRANVQ